jgi:hypothetical protein
LLGLGIWSELVEVPRGVDRTFKSSVLGVFEKTFVQNGRIASVSSDLSSALPKPFRVHMDPVILLGCMSAVNTKNSF